MDAFLTILAVVAAGALFVTLSVKIPGFASTCLRLVIWYLRWAWKVSSAVIRAVTSR